MAKANEVETMRLKLLPKQTDFITSDAERYLLYSGALAAGKTRALCYRAIRLAMRHPSARVGLCRKSLVSLKRTTMVTLLERDGENPPCLPAGTYHYKKTAGEQEIELNGADQGKIIPFGCDNPEAVGSLNLSDVCIDEGIELDKPEWNMLDGRVRIQYYYPYYADAKPGERRKGQRKNKNTIVCATNPGPPTHFLYEFFYRRKIPGSRVIQTKTSENIFLPKDYVPSIASHLQGPARQRYLEGEWCAMEGSVYPMFGPGEHVVHDPGPWEFYVAGVDYGFSHKSAMRMWGVRREGKRAPRCHCLAEWYQAGATSPEVVEMAQAAERGYPGTRFVVDQNAPDLIQQMRQASLYVVPGRSGPGDVLQGIRCVAAGLSQRDDSGSPRVTFEPGMSGTDEYMSYTWKPDALKEEPVKKNDDAVDADRYALVDIHDHATLKRLLFVGDHGEPVAQDGFHGIENYTEVDPMTDERFWSECTG